MKTVKTHNEFIPRLNNKFKNKKYNYYLGAGFTLIEILVVAGLIVFMASILIKNFSGGKFDLGRTANQVEADIRLAQTYSLAAKRLSGSFRCGYGVTWVSNTTYSIYAGRDTTTNNCTPSFAFINAGSTPIYKSTIIDPKIEILSFQDVFYLPPDPRLYAGPSANQSSSPTLITLRRTTAANCNNSVDCRFVCVYPSGKIDIYTNANLCN